MPEEFNWNAPYTSNGLILVENKHPSNLTLQGNPNFIVFQEFSQALPSGSVITSHQLVKSLRASCVILRESEVFIITDPKSLHTLTNKPSKLTICDKKLATKIIPSMLKVTIQFVVDLTEGDPFTLVPLAPNYKLTLEMIPYAEEIQLNLFTHPLSLQTILNSVKKCRRLDLLKQYCCDNCKNDKIHRSHCLHSIPIAQLFRNIDVIEEFSIAAGATFQFDEGILDFIGERLSDVCPLKKLHIQSFEKFDEEKVAAFADALDERNFETEIILIHGRFADSPLFKSYEKEYGAVMVKWDSFVIEHGVRNCLPHYSSFISSN